MSQFQNPPSKISLNRSQPHISLSSGNYNRQIISSLKEEIGNIRQNMSKLIKVRSGENDGYYAKSYGRTQNLGVREIRDRDAMKGADFKNLNRDSEMIKLLQEENARLREKVRVLEQSKISERENYKQKLNELQIQNTILTEKIVNLNSTLAKQQQKQKKHNRSPKSRIQFPLQLLQIDPNPELCKVPIFQPNINIQLLTQNNMKMLGDIRRFQERIKFLEFANAQSGQIIGEQNQGIVRDHLTRLSRKYQY